MSDLGWVLLVIFGTAVVTLLAVWVGSVVTTLAEIRRTARTVREALERLAPKVELVLDNAGQVSGAAARGAAALVRIGEMLPLRRAVPGGGSRPMWAMALAALAGLIAAIRRRRAARRGADRR